MKIVIPDLLMPSWNQLYAGMHWTQRKQLVDLIHWQVRAAVGPDAEPFSAPVAITVTAYRTPVLDADNVAAKLVVDGLKAANVLVDDGPAWVSSVTTACRHGKPCVEVVIDDAVE